MKKSTFGIVITVAALLAIGGVVVVNKTDKTKPAATASSNSSGHDATNGDGHHNSDTEKNDSPVLDLTNQSEVSMDIKDFKYEKPNIKIKKGTKVTWTNRDTIQHNVMREHEGADQAHNAPKPEEVKPDELAGPLLTRGESYSFIFNEVSSNPYHCSPHPYMKGSVTVVD